jgi:hypothetical protein
MALSLAPLGTLSLTMSETLILPNSPVGTRGVVTFTEIAFEGERLRGTGKGVAGDWLTIGPEGTASLDLRFVLQSHDGALIFVHGTGRTQAASFAQGGAVWFTPRFETGDARYAWLNAIQAVARGSAIGNRVSFEVAELR